jgi:hypothetical protein
MRPTPKAGKIVDMPPVGDEGNVKLAIFQQSTQASLPSAAASNCEVGYVEWFHVLK